MKMVTRNTILFCFYPFTDVCIKHCVLSTFPSPVKEIHRHITCMGVCHLRDITCMGMCHLRDMLTEFVFTGFMEALSMQCLIHMSVSGKKQIILFIPDEIFYFRWKHLFQKYMNRMKWVEWNWLERKKNICEQKVDPRVGKKESLGWESVLTKRSETKIQMLVKIMTFPHFGNPWSSRSFLGTVSTALRELHQRAGFHFFFFWRNQLLFSFTTQTINKVGIQIKVWNFSSQRWKVNGRRRW